MIYTITLKRIQPVGWFCFLLFVGLSGLMVGKGEFWLALFFIFFSFIGGYIIVGSFKRYWFDEHALHAQNVLGWSYRMAWAEVRQVEVDYYGTLVFHGMNKRFVLPPPGFWQGENPQAMYNALRQHFVANNISPVANNLAAYKGNKNVRIHSNA